MGRREYDPKHVGFVTTPDDDGDDDGFWLDTTHLAAITTLAMPSRPTPRPGRSILQDPKANPLPHGVIGPEFTDDERYAIIEYLKVHRDLPATPADYQPPQCRLRGETL